MTKKATKYAKIIALKTHLYKLDKKTSVIATSQGGFFLKEPIPTPTLKGYNQKIVMFRDLKILNPVESKNQGKN